ncbi:cytochrome c oxidase subunit 2 [Thalassobacillus cyri]|uniref:Cytochrome c oxidase subunit 2 n=1 Tax=Thalassobacillus cyri TaxID=571932 RepID=A0A1H4DH47_9BACI|nr:cytochrome c oxidase subunit II [Thalassobacillus cyri]SEA71779.1 cytochrome c oxidase subunit 2 [Thalassobacillus cyri]
MKILVLLSFLFILSGCNLRVLDPKTQTASDQAFLIYLSFGIMMFVVLVVALLFIAFTVKYRETEKNRHDVPKHEEGNRTLEIIWTVLPIILLIGLAVPTVMITYDVSYIGASSDDNAVHVNVTGEQFRWTFEYENGKETHKKLVLPEDREVIFHLTSKDVIHSFWVPKLAGKIDVLPGEENRLKVTPEETGTYQGKCAEYCGTLHADMRFEAEVMEQEEFQAWLNEE